ncbi:hypothetical protein N0V94_003811 [Neodidymelliopsis sp. IMI 364377]|nr:hypothetical protein N0V94_003811 [Neodidymelliopsis sp. IMI 364377]
MSIADLNRKYFDAISDSYDNKPWWSAVNNQVADELRSKLDWIGIPFANMGSSDAAEEVRLLDYACGTGLMTRTFGPYVTRTLGIDISPNMISTYKTRALNASLPPTTVDAVVGDLFDKADPTPPSLAGSEWWNFDLATVGFGFHHFEDVVYAAEQLKERLRPGGVLVINDFLEGGDVLADEKGEMVEGSEGNHAVHSHGHGHKHSHSHKHNHDHDHHQHSHSNTSTPQDNDFTNPTPSLRQKMTDSIVVPHFTISGVRDFFTAAGYIDVDVFTMKERSYMEFGGKKMWRRILVAKGRKPAEKEEKKSEL